MPNYKIHPLAEIFPPFTDQEFKELVKDIGEHGQRNVITLYEGKILDGVHRYRACLQLHMEPRVRNFSGQDPLAFAISANLKRRHLTESQRGVIAAELSTNKNGRPRENRSPRGTVSNKQAAEALDVSEHTVDRAKSVLKHAPEETIEAVRNGDKSLRAAEREIKQKKKIDKEQFLDNVGRPIPEDLIAEWKRAEDTGKQLKSLAQKIKSIVAQGFTGAKQDRIKDPIYAELNNSIISDAQALSWSFTSIIPYALCPTCSGRNRKECTLCKKRGWISKFLWNSPAVNENVRKMIERKAS